MKWMALWLLRLYKITLSPLLGTSCRFYPTCSDYARDAIQKFGFFKGSYLMIKRLLKCHPWHPGGVDKVN